MWLQDLLCCRVSCEKAALLSCTPPWLFNLSSDLFCGVKLLACFCLAPHYTFCSFWVTKGGWLEWNLSSPILGFNKKTQDFVKSKFSSLCLEIFCHQMRLSNTHTTVPHYKKRLFEFMFYPNQEMWQIKQYYLISDLLYFCQLLAKRKGHDLRLPPLMVPNMETYHTYCTYMKIWHFVFWAYSHVFFFGVFF